jgi:hypothetical protein
LLVAFPSIYCQKQQLEILCSTVAVDMILSSASGVETDCLKPLSKSDPITKINIKERVAHDSSQANQDQKN